MADIISKKKRSWNMSHIRGKRTKPEIVFKKYGGVFLANSYFWYRHKNFPDAIKPEIRSEFWEQKLGQTFERDRKYETALKELGGRVFCVWECELKRDAVRVTSDVAGKMREVENGNRT